MKRLVDVHGLFWIERGDFRGTSVRSLDDHACKGNYIYVALLQVQVQVQMQMQNFCVG